MTVALVAAISAATAVVVWLGLRDLFSRDMFARTNVRGRSVPVGVGIVIPVAAAVASAAFEAGTAIGLDVPPEPRSALTSMLVVVLGFSLLGLLDDLAADVGVSGFRGHLRSIRSGRLSAGALKLLAGGVLGVVAAAPHTTGGLGPLVLGAVIVSLAANLANLFDRAPGRVTKVAILTGAALLVATSLNPSMAGVAAVLGAAVGLLVPDLREQLMLGDAGSNAIGAALGVGVVVAGSTRTQLVVLLVLVGFNALSEFRSFSAIIAGTPPLRWLDQLGRPRA